MDWTRAGVLLLLTGSLFWDIKNRHIPLWWLWGNGMLAIAALYVNATAFSEALWGILPGIVLLIIAVVTRGRIGKGDALLIVVLGLYSGLWACFSVLLLSLALTAVYGMCRGAIRHTSLKKAVIFTPFLWAGYGIWWACSLI
jgi:leader peptidase (prepilin peptidase)/N-methyltransferase